MRRCERAGRTHCCTHTHCPRKLTGDFGDIWIRDPLTANGIARWIDRNECGGGYCNTVNRGGDTDIIGAITEAVAGARLGASELLSRWLSSIDGTVEIESLADQLVKMA